MPDYTSKYLNFISKSWDTTIPIKTLWVLEFLSLQSVIRNVETILEGTERIGGTKKFPTFEGIITESLNGQLIATKVDLPSDTTNYNRTGNSNMGGLLGAAYVNNRQSYNDLSIEFLETNRDFTNYVLRPWQIAVSYMGLIADPNMNLKCDVKLYQYTLYNNDNWKIINTYLFENVAPTAVPGNTLEYDIQSNLTILKKGSFVFNRYYLLDNDDTGAPTTAPRQSQPSFGVGGDPYIRRTPGNEANRGIEFPEYGNPDIPISPGNPFARDVAGLNPTYGNPAPPAL